MQPEAPVTREDVTRWYVGTFGPEEAPLEEDDAFDPRLVRRVAELYTCGGPTWTGSPEDLAEREEMLEAYCYDEVLAQRRKANANALAANARTVAGSGQRRGTQQHALAAGPSLAWAVASARTAIASIAAFATCGHAEQANCTPTCRLARTASDRRRRR